nr:microtubule-associated protein TORTIFOLIA1-like [Ipomoea batatas]GMC56295.1 microtubule-associated protein TORTIFOLIA1-like [Ipomoea batatas]
MNQMLEAWKEIPDLPDDNVSPRPQSNSSSKASKDDLKATKPETRRALFGQKAAGSRVVPYHEEKSEHTVVMSNETGDLYRNQKECEELSQIRKQLVQIETQQSNLIDTLQLKTMEEDRAEFIVTVACFR